MTFEERMKWEKAMIGYPVSGHPLDGIEEFIHKKSKNLGAIFDWIEKKNEGWGMDDDVGDEVNGATDSTSTITKSEGEIAFTDSDVPPVSEEESIIVPEKKQEPEETVYATLIGLVHEVRKIQTKTGGMMLMATVESVGFDFRLTVFSRDYEAYAAKVEEDKIIVVDGRVKFDEERDEISISPGGWFGKKWGRTDAIKTFSISQFRELAGKGEQYDTKPEDESTLAALTHKPGVYTIDIPSYWTKEDLLDLRDYLSQEKVGLHPIWIRVNGLEKDTKFTIENLDGLKKWVEERMI